MALIGKPTVKSTTAFAINSQLNENPYIVNFTWSGQRCNGNRLTIVETGLSNDIMGLSSTFHKLTKTVCDNLGLTNGNTYHATITMLDYEGNPASNPSDQFLLYCYAVPIFTIRNLNNNSIVKSTEFMALLNYYSKTMALSSYKFNLYDATGTVLLDSSDELYEIPDENTTDYSLCSYTFKGLENSASYYIKAKGVTVYGMELQCSYHITVETNASSVYSTISANATRDGNVSLDINCIPMGYEYNNISYIDNEEINLTGNDSYVKYTLINPLNDFEFMGKLRGIKDLNKPLISFSSNSDETTISLIPSIQYIHGTISPNVDINNLIRPIPFVYKDQINATIELSVLHSSEKIYTNEADTFILTDDDGLASTNFVFHVWQYDEDDNLISDDIIVKNQIVNISNASYIRFFIAGSDGQYTVSYTIESMKTYIDYIEQAYMSLNLYVNNKQYTVNGSSFALDYDSENDIFYLDPNKEFLIDIVRINGNYKLKVIENTIIIICQPQDVSVEVGQYATISVEAIGNGLTYQWQFSKDGGLTWSDSTAIGTVSNNIQVLANEELDETQYRCIITDNEGGTVISESSTLTIIIPNIIITSQPQSVNVSSGTTVTVGVEAQGEGLTYQWQLSDDNGTTWRDSTSASAVNSAMTFVMKETFNGRMMRCVITDAQGNTVISDSATLSLTT